MSYVFEPAPRVTIPVLGVDGAFPVRRILCAGANYAAHVREMGREPGEVPPFFFFKPTDAIVASGSTIPYPTRTENLHHEVELVVAIGKPGLRIKEGEASDLIYGYAVGIDMTRRDIQMSLAKKGLPWEFGKAFDQSAICSTLHRVSETGVLSEGRIWLAVNGQIKQDGDLNDLIAGVPKLLVELSEMIELQPGDIVYTGTPAGVGPVRPGDVLTGGIDGLTDIEVTIGPPR